MSKVKIVIDSTPTNPRTEMDNLGTMLTKRNIENNFYVQAKESLSSKDYSKILDNKGDALEIKNILEKTNQFLIFNLYRYEHGNCIYKIADENPFGCRFDSGLAGWIVVPKNKVRNEYSCQRITKKIVDKVLSVVSSEMDIYTDYCNGDVYGYFSVDSTGEEDSCFGFFGDNFETNGMFDYIPEEFHNLLKQKNYSIDQWINLNGDVVNDDEELYSSAEDNELVEA